MANYEILVGNVFEKIKEIPDETIDTVVTSPPYWGLRDYGQNGQIGLEKTPDEYVEQLVNLFQEIRRTLKKEGTVWLNIGDSYVGTGHKGNYKDPKYSEGRNGQAVAVNNKVDGLKSKDLVGIPWRVAFALQASGWYLRQEIIWAKSNPMPESVTDRCTKSHESIFLLSKSPSYYFDHEAIREPAKKSETKNDTKDPLPKRNKRDVWTVPVASYKGAHFATFPEELITPCILAGAPLGGVVFDPFAGSGTTLYVANKNGRNAVGIELNPQYVELINLRMKKLAPRLF